MIGRGVARAANCICVVIDFMNLCEAKRAHHFFDMPLTSRRRPAPFGSRGHGAFRAFVHPALPATAAQEPAHVSIPIHNLAPRSIDRGLVGVEDVDPTGMHLEPHGFNIALGAPR